MKNIKKMTLINRLHSIRLFKSLMKAVDAKKAIGQNYTSFITNIFTI
jgi:hypothetical protein